MRLSNKYILILLFSAFGMTYLNGQETGNFKVSYEIHKVYKTPKISPSQVNGAISLVDLNPHFKPKWVKSYDQVAIKTLNNGIYRESYSKNDSLTMEQIKRIKNADFGSTIKVNVRYMPDNSLTHNELKEFNFSFSVLPENEAQFIGGKEKLEAYLEHNFKSKITDSKFQQYNLTAVNFSIDELGAVTNVQLAQPSKDIETANYLVETLCNMPDWKPATYSNGAATNQDFVLTAGDTNSCTINMLNIFQ